MADLVPLRDLPLDRRRLLGCAALFGVSGPLLVSCSSGSSDDEGSGGTETAAGETLVATADVPVGGGVLLEDLGIVVTQPKKDEFAAFENVCPHQGGKLPAPEDGVMVCPLHGSQFSVTGENLVGPGGEPAGSVADLTAVEVEVQGSDVVRA